MQLNRNASRLEELSNRIEQHTRQDGIYATAISNLTLFRFSTPTEPTAVVYEPSLCLIAKGSKQVLLGEESYRYDPSHFLLVSVELPVSGCVIEASESNPYLGLRITLNPAVVGELLADGAVVPQGGNSMRGMAVQPLEPELLDAVNRYVALLDAPNAIGPLSPLIFREMNYRILISPLGNRLRQIVSPGAPAQRIAQAIQWLRIHFAEPLRIESLAKQVRMSPSAFHLHFKNVTSMSPLQYQKRLRLQEARRLMFTESLDAAEAAFRVGYESPSQFSREYRRLFGAPPRTDVASLKLDPQPSVG